MRTKTILIVDDEPGIRKLFRKMVAASGYRVIEAWDGYKALQILREKKNIDLLLLDIMLPTINGLDMFEAVKKNFPRPKIIITSVYPRNDQEFLIWGANDYYDKSEDISVLMNKITTLLQE